LTSAVPESNPAECTEALLSVQGRLRQRLATDDPIESSAQIRFPLGGGQPDPGSFPVRRLAGSAQRVLESDPGALLYGAGQGYLPLREIVCRKTNRLEELALESDQVLITNGAAQALGLLATALIDPGDTVLIDEVSWGAGFFKGFGADLQPVRWDEYGPLPQDIEAAWRRRRVKVFYTIPTFQNPLGVTASLERRRQILDLADRHGFLIAEDDAYYELRFAGERVPSLFELSGGNRVVRTGTFSKILGAGTRLGWAMADRKTIDLLAAHKYDLGASPFTSRIVADFMQRHMFAHIRRLQRVYRVKRDALLAVFEAELADLPVNWSRPEGGFFCWLQLPPGCSGERVEQVVAQQGVDVWAGSWFRSDGHDDNCLRIAYSFATLDQIREGAEIFCRELRGLV
jgi:2-aminoadipate transaminase